MMAKRSIKFVTLILVTMLLAACGTESRPERAASNGVDSNKALVSALYPSYTDAEMVERSEGVVLAKVLKKGEIYREGNVAFTEFKISILHSFKGGLSGEVTVTFEGTDTEEYEGNPLPVLGKEYIFFLRRVPENNRLVLLNGPFSRFEHEKGRLMSGVAPNIDIDLKAFRSRFGFGEQ